MTCLASIPALRPLSDAERAALDDFCRAMEAEVIPEVIETLRERQKQASRNRDERLLAAGVAAAEIEDKNAFLRADRTIVHWERSKPL